MITFDLRSNVVGKPVSALSFITQRYVHLNDGAATPAGFSIPVPAGSTGLTVVCYTRKPTGDFEKYSIYVDGSNGVAGGLHSQETSVQGIFAGGFRVNGQPFPYGPLYLYGSRTWTQVALRTTNNTSQRGAGALYFNLFAGSAARTDGLPAVDYTYVAIYQRELSDNELSGLLPPTDMTQLYTFAGYQPGDVVLVEQLGTGLDGTLYY